MNKHISLNINTRDYQAGDYDEVQKLWDNLGLGSRKRGDNEDVILQTLQHGGKFILLIDKTNNKIIGTSWITTDYRRLYLHHFGISQDYQGLGLSHLLLEKTLDFAREKNMQIKLEVNRKNFRAVNLYRKAGFENLGDYDVYIIRDIQHIDYKSEIFKQKNK